MIGVEVVAISDGAPRPDLAEAIVRRARDDGVLLIRSGPEANVIRIPPPLVITDDELGLALDVIEASADAVLESSGRLRPASGISRQPQRLSIGCQRMRSWRSLFLVASLTLFGLAWPTASPADHVGITAEVSAVLKERLAPGSWIVEVSWSVACTGAGASGASYSGNLNLVDEQTGERIYLGGVSSASGKVRQPVGARRYWRKLHPELKISCWDNGTLHGAGPIVVIGGASAAGGVVLIPPLDGVGDPPGTGSGGTGGSDPTEPLRAGGCLRPIVGTDAPDTLIGSGEGDIIFGRGGSDRIRGSDGHDCLIGGAGNDTLRGERGDDRITGGRGADTLLGGAGVNAYYAGPGNDFVNSANGRVELVSCGSGQDRAIVDRRDRVSSCERVTRTAP
jgi:hypothetical protein